MDEPRGILLDGLKQLGYSDPAGLANSLLAYAELLLAANRDTNLIGARELGDVMRHLLDSLAPLAGRALGNPVVDVGSGGGLPGMAMAMADHAKRIVLLEPRAKRAAFLAMAIAQLGLENVRVERMSAQKAIASGFAGSFQTALARALAKPATAIRLCLPLLGRGGKLVAYLGRQAKPKPAEARAIDSAGGVLEEALPVSVPYQDAKRHVWIIRRRST